MLKSCSLVRIDGRPVIFDQKYLVGTIPSMYGDVFSHTNPAALRAARVNVVDITVSRIIAAIIQSQFSNVHGLLHQSELTGCLDTFAELPNTKAKMCSLILNCVQNAMTVDFAIE